MLNKEHFWIPFTGNRDFKKRPKLLKSAKGMYYYSEDNRKILDGTAGLWCVNAGNANEHIINKMQQQVKKMYYAPPFNLAHNSSFELAEKLAEIAPKEHNHVFFTNSGSESVDSALKIALAYQKVRGKASKFRIIGREKGYHGVGFGGISVGGMVNNRNQYGVMMLPGVDHLPHTLNISKNAFTKGLPAKDVTLANKLEDIVALHGADTIAAVIVEPIAGSAGVILPPQGYLKRLREICDQHDILLIFDEVITGFGRIGDAFAATHWGVIPDLIVTAKGLTSGASPMGAVIVKDKIYETFMEMDRAGIELFHGYTYSAHPVSVAAALAALDVYKEQNLFEKAKELSNYWQDGLHSLKELPHVIDIRNYGLMGAIEFEPIEGHIGKRGMNIFNEAFFNQDLLVRVTGDILALSPPLIIEKHHIDELVTKLEMAIKKSD